MIIEINNDGAAIASTNYWDTQHAQRGLFYLSWNAGCARLLVPDSRLAEVHEMRTARRWVVVSRGQFRGGDAIELLFDDGSDSPYAIQLDMRQTDRIVTDDHLPFTVDAWTRGGKVASWPGRYRVVDVLPCLAAWSEH